VWGRECRTIEPGSGRCGALVNDSKAPTTEKKERDHAQINKLLRAVKNVNAKKEGVLDRDEGKVTGGKGGELTAELMKTVKICEEVGGTLHTGWDRSGKCGRKKGWRGS